MFQSHSWPDRSCGNPRGWADRLALPTQGPQRLAGSSIHVALARFSSRGHLPPCQPLGLRFVTFLQMAHFKFLYFLWTEWVPTDPQMQGLFSETLMCELPCYHMHWHDMKDSQSRMFGTHRLLFEEDLQTVASRHRRWLTHGREQAS